MGEEEEAGPLGGPDGVAGAAGGEEEEAGDRVEQQEAEPEDLPRHPHELRVYCLRLRAGNLLLHLQLPQVVERRDEEGPEGENEESAVVGAEEEVEEGVESGEEVGDERDQKPVGGVAPAPLPQVDVHSQAAEPVN